MSSKIVESLEGILLSNIRQCVLLYSGGIDGTYFLDWATKQGIEVTALHVGLGANNNKAKERSEKFNVHYEFQDRTDEFLDKYISKGILANAYNNSSYPISATFSRPLMASTAVDVAKRKGIHAIVHTSNATQNSSPRFYYSFMAIDHTIQIVNPFLKSHITREQKLKRLREIGVDFGTGIYSIDENIWCREIESGSLENPENNIPDDGIFEWTKKIEDTPDYSEVREVEFEEGLPIAVNGERASLLEIVQNLNAVGREHGIGRFDGLESNIHGKKNHEVREAPAAHIITTGHRELESIILSEAEQLIKGSIDTQWVNFVMKGFWYFDIAEALFEFIKRMNRIIDGKLKFKLFKGNIIILSRTAQNGLYNKNLKNIFGDDSKDLDYSALYRAMGLPYFIRKNFI